MSTLSVISQVNVLLAYFAIISIAPVKIEVIDNCVFMYVSDGSYATVESILSTENASSESTWDISGN